MEEDELGWRGEFRKDSEDRRRKNEENSLMGLLEGRSSLSKGGSEK